MNTRLLNPVTRTWWTEPLRERKLAANQSQVRELMNFYYVNYLSSNELKQMEFYYSVLSINELLLRELLIPQSSSNESTLIWCYFDQWTPVIIPTTYLSSKLS